MGQMWSNIAKKLLVDTSTIFDIVEAPHLIRVPPKENEVSDMPFFKD